MPDICPPPPEYVKVLNALTPRYQLDRQPLPCTARIEWATGAETMETVATRYDPRDNAVFVLIPDPRCQFTGAWLSRAAVRIHDGDTAVAVYTYCHTSWAEVSWMKRRWGSYVGN